MLKGIDKVSTWFQALEKAKDAGRKERILVRQREQVTTPENINLDLTYSVSMRNTYWVKLFCLGFVDSKSLFPFVFRFFFSPLCFKSYWTSGAQS